MVSVNKSKKKYRAILIVNISLIIILMVYSIFSIRKDYYECIGKRVMSIAISTADNIELSNADVEYLKSMDFNSLLRDPINIEFEKKVRRFMKFADIKYIYLLTHLEPNRVKYFVDSNEAAYYEKVEGTALNFIYLLDAVVSKETRQMDTLQKGYTDKDRYTTLSYDTEEVYFNEKSLYQFSNDQWGGYITGYAPVYSQEGQYIGILGVDVSLIEYSKAINNETALISTLGLLSTITTIFLFRSLRKIHRAERTANIFKHMSYTDDMTGFLNRRTLNEQADEYWNMALDQNITITIMMIDIDYFKAYNDKYGHTIGDQVISKVTSVIRFCTRDNIDLLFRYGGDEFMIMFFNTDLKTVSLIAERIREHAKNIHINDIKDNISLSFGIATKMPSKNEDLFKLIDEADMALYMSKNKGRDSIHIYEKNND